MATSGDITFNLTRADIITEAMELLGVLGEGDVPNAAQTTSASRTLNMMLKSWQNRGTHLFVTQEIILFLEKNKSRYIVDLAGGSASDRSCVFTDFVKTNLDGALAASATAVTVDDTTGMAAADEIGIETTGGTLFWDIILSVDSPTTLTLTTGVDAAAADRNDVYTFTNRASRWRKILNCVVTTDNDVETPVEVIARQDWTDLSVKLTSGRVNQIYWKPLWKTAEMFVWTQTDDETDYLHLWVQRQIEDMDNDADDFDLPNEWYLAIAYNLALLLAVKFGVSDKTWARINVIAEQTLIDAESDDTEDSMYFTPDDRWDGMGHSRGY